MYIKHGNISYRGFRTKQNLTMLIYHSFLRMTARHDDKRIECTIKAKCLRRSVSMGVPLNQIESSMHLLNGTKWQYLISFSCSLTVADHVRKQSFFS